MEQGSLLTVHARLDKYWYTKRHEYKHGHNRLKKKCSHAAAILIKIECAVWNGYIAATSIQCSWNQMVQQKKVLYSCSATLFLLAVSLHSMSQPRSYIDIDFPQPKAGCGLSYIRENH